MLSCFSTLHNFFTKFPSLTHSFCFCPPKILKKMATCGRIHSPRSDESLACALSVIGKHHCPGILATIPFDGNTHYRVLHAKAGEGRSSFAPRSQFTATPVAPGHYLTTNQTHGFSQADVQRPTSCKPRNELSVPAPFMGATTQRTDYQAYQVQPRCSSAPPRRPLDKTVGSYETTNRAMQGPVIMALRESPASSPLLHRTPSSITVSRLRPNQLSRILPAEEVSMSGCCATGQRCQVSLQRRQRLYDHQSESLQTASCGGICPAAKFSRRPVGDVTCKVASNRMREGHTEHTGKEVFCMFGKKNPCLLFFVTDFLGSVALFFISF